MLRREFRKLTRKVIGMGDELSEVQTTRSKKKMHPQAERILGEIDELKRRRKGIERNLGGVPESGAASHRLS